MSHVRTLLGAGAFALLSGCTRGQLTSPSGTTLSRSAAARNPGSSSSDPWLYVSAGNDNAVVVYDLAQPGYPVVQTITQGIDGPNHIALDSNGVLYVPNVYPLGAGTVSVYPPGQTTPSLILTGLTYPIGAAVDSSGDVFVTNYNDPSSGNPSSIAEYAPGQTMPSNYITGSQIQYPCSLYFDSAGNLYLADVETGISVMKVGSNQFTSLNLKGLGNQPGAVAVDPRGNIFEADADPPNGEDAVRRYRPGHTSPKHELYETSPVHGITVGTISKGRHSNVDLFVPAYTQDATVYIFRDNGEVPYDQIATGHNGLNGVAFKPAGIP